MVRLVLHTYEIWQPAWRRPDFLPTLTTPPLVFVVNDADHDPLSLHYFAPALHGNGLPLPPRFVPTHHTLSSTSRFFSQTLFTLSAYTDNPRPPDSTVGSTFSPLFLADDDGHLLRNLATSCLDALRSTAYVRLDPTGDALRSTA